MIFPPPLPSVKNSSSSAKSLLTESNTKQTKTTTKREVYRLDERSFISITRIIATRLTEKKFNFLLRSLTHPIFFSFISRNCCSSYWRQQNSHTLQSRPSEAFRVLCEMWSRRFVECEINFRDERREGSAIKSPVTVIIYVAAEKTHTYRTHDTRYARKPTQRVSFFFITFMRAYRRNLSKWNSIRILSSGSCRRIKKSSLRKSFRLNRLWERSGERRECIFQFLRKMYSSDWEKGSVDFSFFSAFPPQALAIDYSHFIRSLAPSLSLTLDLSLSHRWHSPK